MQLYCVRSEMAKDPAATLKALSNMGYRYVEHANYVEGKFYGYSPQAFKELLSSLGMSMPSGHTVMKPSHYDTAANSFTDVWKKTIEDAAFMGQKYIISPSMDSSVRKSYDALKLQLDWFNRCGELCKKYGMQFGYHNHEFEFTESHGDRLLYEIILDETDPGLVTQQFDTGNILNSKVEPIAMIKKYADRFDSIHVKDGLQISSNPNKYESTILGTGVVPLQEILTIICKVKSAPHLIIEQESYQGKAPIDCMQENLRVMKQWGYV